MGKFTNNLNNRIEATSSKYHRELFQTFLTAPEWKNVEMSEEFANFLKEGKSFHHFPYFKEIAEFWRVFNNSYQAARKYNGRLEIITSDYMFMNIFIGLFSSVEYITKGLFSLTLWPFLPKENNTQFQQYVSGLFNDYASFIHKTPFYNYPYFSKIKPLAQHFLNSDNKSLVDFVTFFSTLCELNTRGIISLPVAGFYNQEVNQEDEKISLIVKKSVSTQAKPEEFKQEFLNLIKEIELLQRNTSTESIEIVSQHEHEQTYARQSTKKDKTYAYAHIRVPRYEAFYEVVKELVANEIKIAKIAGQDRLQIKCTAHTKDPEALAQTINTITIKTDCSYLYGYKGISFFDVPTKKIPLFLDTVENTQGATVTFMHDF